MPSRKTRFVVLCLQGFGDALEATPLVEQLRKNVPSAEILVVAMRPQVRDLYEALPQLADRVVYVPYWERGMAGALGSIVRLPFSTASEASFLAYPAARAEYAVFARAIASRTHYAHDYGHAGVARIAGRGGTRLVPVALKHNVLRNLDLLAAAGFPVVTPVGYVVPETWKAPRDHPTRVLMHLGSIAHHGLEAKRWPPEMFLELGRSLQRASIDVVLLSGPAEREETERIARELGNATIVSGDMPTVARALASVGAVVANDNGIAHLAAGVGTPVVALMGPTPPQFGPYGATAIAYRPSGCPPCFDVAKTDMRCALDIDYACLKRDITVDAVLELVTRALGPVARDELRNII